MNSELMQRHVWYPTERGGETFRQREETVALDWLRANLSKPAQREWLRYAAYSHPSMRCEEAIRTICKHDSAELVDLLYPRAPQLFRKARKYTLSAALFSNLLEAPFSEDILMQCVHARTAHLDAACLFALTGAVGCLEKLLEYGTDPDGLDSPDSWSYIDLPNGQILPVSPMDCALLGGKEDCQLLLELYGGTTLHQHLKE